MKKFTNVFIAFLIGIVLSLGSITEVYAKRMGGGRSFGARPAYSQPYSRSASTPARSASQQQAHTQNQAARQTLNKRGGLMGMLGGLALGGLLGAMFFGGAFQGINFFDILMFGGVAYLLFKLFAAKSAMRPRPAQTYGENGQYRSSYSDYETPQDTAADRSGPSGFNTDVLFKKDNKTEFESPSGDADFEPVHTPADFDRQAFLDGAKAAFKMLQAAWDKGDLADIRGLTTDKVFAEIQEQLQSSNEENRTEILKIEAELLDYREIGNELEAVVMFDTIMREDRDGQAGQVREVWHFVKPKHSLQPKWYLDGIQQLED